VRFILLVLMFVVSMIFLIISPNIIRILLEWDGLGLVSYLLVIYYQNVKSYGAGMLTVLSVFDCAGTERIVVQPFTVYDIKEDGVWHVERLKVTAVPNSICVCYLIFAPLKILSHLKNCCGGFCKYCETDTSLTFCAADGKNHDSASSQRGLHILYFCDLFLACHESSEGLHKNI
jgi:hypothetical protein